MKMWSVCSATAALALSAVLAFAASPPDTSQMVVTVRPPQQLAKQDMTMLQDKKPVHIQDLRPLPADLSDLQLFIYLDDSTQSASLSTHFKELKNFIASLPAPAQVAIGYMRNGTFVLAQAFTTDHAKAAASLRLPDSLPGENGSPYFALSDLVKHWPSQQPGRRAVLMLTDGVDRYYGEFDMQDPYVDAAISDSLKAGVQVSTIYLRGAGLYGRAGWTRDFAQSRLMQVADQTGGHSYFEAFTDPVDIAPFLSDFHQRLQDQYLLTFAAAGHGVESVKLQTEVRGVKLEAPSRVYVH